MKGRKFLSTVLTALVLSVVVNMSNVKAAEISRVGGADRITTANNVAISSFGKASNVVLVNGYGYADAASATPLAKELDAPILLTEGKTLEASVAAAIQNLGASKVYIVGGTGVVSSKIEAELKSKYGQGSVERIAGVADTSRMGTNAEVVKKLIQLKQGSVDTAILVNGQDGYADALSVASIAAQKGYPVLYANSKEVAPVVKDVISKNGIKTILGVGGEAVLPSAVVSSVGGAKITKAEDSKNRFSTNLAVLKYFKENGGLDFSNIYLAAGGSTAGQFADALVASAAAAKAGSPLVLSGVGADSSAVSAANDYILTNVLSSSKVIIVGGTGSVSETIEAQLKSGDVFEVISIE